jgi:hypothetical protein
MQPDQKYVVIRVTATSIIFLGIAIGSVLKIKFPGAYYNEDGNSFNLSFKQIDGHLHAIPCDGKPFSGGKE